MRLSIKNWSEYQHYRDRTPPWIKLATDTFQNYEFSRLSDPAKLLAIASWTLASRTKEGFIPDDFQYVKNQCVLGDLIKQQHFNELISKGFLIPDSESLASRKQSACLEGETEGYRKEGETEEIYAPNQFENFWDAFPTQRRGNSKKALAAWQQALKRAPAEKILEGLKNYATSDEVAKGFAKGAAAWLNDDRWANDYSRKEIPHESSRSGSASSTDGSAKPTKTDRVNAIVAKHLAQINADAGRARAADADGQPMLPSPEAIW